MTSLDVLKRIRHEQFMNLLTNHDTFDHRFQPRDQPYTCKHITLSGTQYIAGRTVVAVKETHTGIQLKQYIHYCCQQTIAIREIPTL